jgi:hypothetical protein
MFVGNFLVLARLAPMPSRPVRPRQVFQTLRQPGAFGSPTGKEQLSGMMVHKKLSDASNAAASPTVLGCFYIQRKHAWLGW